MGDWQPGWDHLLSLALGAGLMALGYYLWKRRGHTVDIPFLIDKHFGAGAAERLTVSERRFPARVRADLQAVLQELVEGDTIVSRFCGLRTEAYRTLSFGELLQKSHTPSLPCPPQYEDVNVGTAAPVACLKNGLWLLERRGLRFAVLLAPVERYTETMPSLSVQIATLDGPGPMALVNEVFDRFEQAVRAASSYRGKILSLEKSSPYSGEAAGITVHQLRQVGRDDVILPRGTLDLLDRNVIHFVKQRPELTRHGQATRKGILFYGPPGTGKTHTIHYLAHALPGHTTLLISAEQVGLLDDYMGLARLLQPSMVIIEDVDLIARDRDSMGGGCEEVMLNKLLNEMDGLREDAEILFILTTNRPETLEEALAARPGRVDQAIEFPLPDDEGREKLVRLYGKGLNLPAGVVRDVVRRTDKVSAAFIKELMRRAVQFHLERQGNGALEAHDVQNALDEMLGRGGTLNLKLLGAQNHAIGFARDNVLENA